MAKTRSVEEPREVIIVPGVAGPAWFETKAQPERGHRVVVRVEFDDAERRYVASELRVARLRDIDTRPVTTESLRHIAVQQIIANHPFDEELRDLPNPGGSEPWGRRFPRRLGREGPTPRSLAWTAHAYRLGYATTGTPKIEVERAIGLSRATAGRWILAARREGLLPAPAGKAGERGRE